MQEYRLTIIDDRGVVEVPALIADGRVRLSPEAASAALGWELGPEGLCREGVCVPLPSGSSVVNQDGIDLVELAGILERPVALDLTERAACLGVSARERSQALASRVAPDFTLPDLNGRQHSLAEYRGDKVLLVVYASW